jgi:basic membrane protein A
VAPNEAITSVVVDWSVYYDYAVDCLVNGKEIKPDWVAGYEENVVSLSQFNDAHISQDTITKVADAEKKLRKGKAKIFKTKEMTVDGETVKSLVKNDKDFKKFKSYVSKGEFQESRKKSAPVMDFLIDGVHESTGNFLTSDDETEEESDY